MVAISRSLPLLATALASLVPVINASFYLYDGSLTDDTANVIFQAHAVEEANRGDCDGIDQSTDLNDYDGDYSYPWPAESFVTADPLCGISLRFEKTGDDYNVYDDAQGNQVSTCVKGSMDTTPCFWGVISGGFVESYYCESDVCS
jgi:hypothetical protein